MALERLGVQEPESPTTPGFLRPRAAASYKARSSTFRPDTGPRSLEAPHQYWLKSAFSPVLARKPFGLSAAAVMAGDPRFEGPFRRRRALGDKTQGKKEEGGMEGSRFEVDCETK